jgi:3-oxoacyl-[acyl-carrier protein] reductase
MDEARLRELAARFPSGHVMAVASDITSADGPAAINERICREWEAPSILVNNAAISPKHNGMAAGLLDVSSHEWLRVFEVNVTACMLMSRQFIPFMQRQKWGRIVNISSRAGRSNVNSAGPAYVTSKAAVLGLTRSIACDFAADGITCNSVAPGVVASAMTGQLPPHLMQRIIDKTPVGRPGSALELGASVAFLASEDAGFITGACLDVNGGQLMC